MDDVEKVARDVYSILKPGMIEAIYHDVVCVGLNRMNHRCEQEYILPIKIYGQQTKRFLKPDILVDGNLIVELKACPKLDMTHQWQVERYLCTSDLHYGILINFGSTLTIRRCERINNNEFLWVTQGEINI